MHLSIKLNPGDRLEGFIEKFIIPEIQIQFLSNINYSLLKNWDNYFINEYKWLPGETPKSAYDIVYLGIQNLTYIRNEDLYIISINPDKKMQGTSAKLYDLCSIINHGTLSIAPYPIFEDIFIKVVPLIPKLFKKYIKYLRRNYK